MTEKVRENTERIAKLEEKVDTLHLDMVEMRGDIKAILNRLDLKEEISTQSSVGGAYSSLRKGKCIESKCFRIFLSGS